MGKNTLKAEKSIIASNLLTGFMGYRSTENICDGGGWRDTLHVYWQGKLRGVKKVEKTTPYIVI